jgi:FkbM family methyltransferase
MPAPTARRAMGPQRRALLCAFVALLLVYAGYAVWRASAWHGGGRRPVKNARAEQAQVPDDRRSGLPAHGESLAPVPMLPHSTKAPAGALLPSAPSPPTLEPTVENADNFVAVCAATRSRSAWTTLDASDPVRILLPSLARTTTAADNVRVFLGANADDAFWGPDRAQELARHARTAWALDVALRQYAHAPNHIPFNALMRDAFDAGAEFLVRVNDDTEFVTPGWVRLGIEALAAFEPPNVGVVGPVCREGKTDILTHDMVHRTHLTIFDTYYPPEFSNWYVDDWISRVYGAARTRRHEGWVVRHRLTPTRYVPQTKEVAKLEDFVKNGRHQIQNKIIGNTQRQHQNEESVADTIVHNPRLSTYAENHSMIRLALELQENALCQQKVGWVPMMIVNTAFLDLLHNWFLLVRKNVAAEAQALIECTLFVCTDLNSVAKLRDDFNVLRTYLWINSVAIEGEMKYGSKIYFELMSDRLELVEMLLKKGVSVALIEADQVFLQNPYEVIGALEMQKRHDIITYDDGGNIPCFGFLFLRPTQRVLQSWSKLMRRMKASPQNEQLLMQTILKEESAPSVRFLPQTRFQSGFAFKQDPPGIDVHALVFVHANWVVGTVEKVKMLKRHGWWLVPTDKDTVHKTKTESAYVHPDLRIIVLTQKRVASLVRLLKSLADAEYEQDRVDVDIWVDWIDDVGLRSAITNTLNAYTWKFGRLSVHYRESTAGLRRQWFETWNLSVPGGLTDHTQERAIILEDDVEVSPSFWKWLREGYKQYEDRKDIAGFSLQRLNLCAKFCPAQNGGPVPDNTNFLHPLVGSWGYSPTLRHWRNFTRWVRAYEPLESLHKPYVQGTQPTAWYKDFAKNGRCPGPNCMWTQLHHFYTSWASDRYTVYAKCERGLTLATNHQEKGLHYGTGMHMDFPRLRTALPEKLFKFEKNPIIVGLDGKLEHDTKTPCKSPKMDTVLAKSFSSICHNRAEKCIRLGTEYGGHEIPHPLCWLQPGDVYYGIGCGEDISFDLQLTSLYSLDMYLFDPTPRAIQHVNNVFDVLGNRTLINEMIFNKNKYTYNTQTFEISGNSNAENWFQEMSKLPVSTSGAKFKPWALADRDGEMEFHEPKQGVSHSLIKTDHKHEKKSDRVVMVKSLQSIMKTLGHKKASVLKIDIEGYEILVIPSLVKFFKTWDQSNWPRLLLFDMDCLRPMHKQYNYTAGMYCIKILTEIGYRIYSAHDYDYTFELIDSENEKTLKKQNQS